MGDPIPSLTYGEWKTPDSDKFDTNLEISQLGICEKKKYFENFELNHMLLDVDAQVWQEKIFLVFNFKQVCFYVLSAKQGVPSIAVFI